MPKHFRDAGHFWGIAPGTPPSVIRSRVADVDTTLLKARSLIEGDMFGSITARHGRVLFDAIDIDRAMAFQAALKNRFAKDLATLSSIRA